MGPRRPSPESAASDAPDPVSDIGAAGWSVGYGVSDTHPDARRRVIEHWRAASVEDRVRAMTRMRDAAVALAQARQDARWPDATPEERKLRLASLWIPREDLIRWWGWDPDVHGR
jgi:hypothetical protein